ncbi:MULTISPECIES: hypothetical protein [Thermoanaerobacter]|jgi:hypothetical protein|uniref:Uncharacterized protein n=1 Tax=Thermoanaerobacter pentosaceus TaxID=694059 RepID=A0ABT9M6Q8_9THEO|nr:MULTISPECIES: hypothetical protein [Thermoanaerobacter]MDP9751570.1 hypothetical protein [Thermoanaerobacter pentosaceus]
MEYLIEGYNKEIGNVFPSDIFPIAPCSCFTIRCEELGVGPCVCWGPYCWGQVCRPVKLEPYYEVRK